MAPVSRRALLHAGLVSAGVTLAGCSEMSGDSSPTATSDPTPTEPPTPRPFKTPTLGECDPLERPRPTPVAGYESKSYPEYPASVDSGAAESFAVAFEEAYRHNRYLADEASEDTQELTVNVGVQSNRTEAVGEGFLVAVDGLFATSEREGQDTIITDDYLFAVYYAGPDVALRRGYEGTPRDAESLRRLAEGGTPVVCPE